METNEALKAVEEINNEYYEKYFDEMPLAFFNIIEFCMMLEYRSNGSSSYIEYLGQIIWGENDNERKFDEDKNCYEPLAPYLKRKMNEMNRLIGSIEL